VTVVTPASAKLAAIEEFGRVKKLREDSTVSDSALLARLEHVKSEHGLVLESPYSEELAGLSAQIQGLVKARNRANSLRADTIPVPEYRAALKSYLDSAKAVRNGHGPTLAADQQQWDQSDPAPGGMSTKVAVGRKNFSEGLDSVFTAGTKAYVTVTYQPGQPRDLWVEWYKMGQVVRAQRIPVTIKQRYYDPEIVDPGKWEVRVLNGKRQLLYRHHFVVN
jgi:hypothetical protein